MYRVGVDIGGTFTDLLLVADDGTSFIGKTLTTHGDPSVAVETAMREGLETGIVDRAQQGTVVHGTTLVTNALIERKGAVTALLTTEGFRDALEIGREHRYELYDLDLELPKPLVPRYLRFDVPERVAADGTVLKPLDEAFVRSLVAELRDKGVRAVAVCYLNSFRNAAHERRTRELIAEVAPEIRVSVSADVVPEIREFQRTSTTDRQRLRAGARRRLSPGDTAAAERPAVHRQLLRDAFQRRHRHPRDGRPVPRAHARVGTGGGGASRGRAGTAVRLPGPSLLRHGRHHRQAVRRGERLSAQGPGVRGGPGLPVSARAAACPSRSRSST